MSTPAKFTVHPDEPTGVSRSRVKLRSQEFARRLHKAMLDRGWNQSDLARAAWGESRADSRGYSQPIGKDRVSVYLKGRVLPDAQNLQKLATALEITVEELAPLNATPTPETSTPTGIRPASEPGKFFVSIGDPISMKLAAKILLMVEEEKDDGGSGSNLENKPKIQFIQHPEHPAH